MNVYNLARLLSLSDSDRFINDFCPYCGAQDHDIAFTGKDRLLNGTEIVNVLKCLNCSGLFTSGKSFSSLDVYYQTAYPPEYHLTFSGGRNGDAGTNPSVANILARLFQKKKNSVKILEVGCGNGGFLHLLNKQGFSVQGIELSLAASTYCKENYGINVFNGTIEEFDTAELYDAIIMLGTIEHFVNPIRTILKAKSLLKSSGFLIFDFPNIDSLEYRLVGPNWWGLDLPRHLLHLRMSEIELILTSVNMQCIKRYGVTRTWLHNSFLSPPLRHGIARTSLLGVFIKVLASILLIVRAKPLQICICQSNS